MSYLLTERSVLRDSEGHRSMIWLRLTITVLAVLLAIVRLGWPSVAIDATTLTLLAIALIPWLAPLFTSVELPGGLKVEFRDLERAGRRAEQVGLITLESTNQTTTYPFQTVASEDPNLALAGLRIEIERRLKELAEARSIDLPSNTGIGRIVQTLDESQVLGPEERSVLMDLIGLLNRAVHGAEVDSRAASWALDVGPQLLDSLGRRGLDTRERTSVGSSGGTG